MSRWFRHYAGLVRDEKLVRVALKARQPIERVVWIWGAILESAAEINDGGRFEFDCEEAAHFLHVDVTECNVTVTELETQGRVSCNIVVNWNERQFVSDSSTERVREHRKREKEKKEQEDREIVTKRSRNENETLRNGPETETEERKMPLANASALSDDADLFRRGKEVLGQKGGSLIAKLKAAKGGSIPLTRAAIEQASEKENPREYVGRIIRGQVPVAPIEFDWDRLVREYQETNNNRWPMKAGPPPDYAGCNAPRDVLERYGFAKAS